VKHNQEEEEEEEEEVGLETSSRMGALGPSSHEN